MTILLYNLSKFWTRTWQKLKHLQKEVGSFQAQWLHCGCWSPVHCWTWRKHQPKTCVWRSGPRADKAGWEARCGKVGVQGCCNQGGEQRQRWVLHGWKEQLAHWTHIWEFDQEEYEGQKGMHILLEFRQEQVFSSHRSKISSSLPFTQESGREKLHLFLLPCRWARQAQMWRTMILTTSRVESQEVARREVMWLTKVSREMSLLHVRLPLFTTYSKVRLKPKAHLPSTAPYTECFHWLSWDGVLLQPVSFPRRITSLHPHPT